MIPLPPRQAPLIAEPEVLVVGGGPAGMGAAVGAARAGARVLLVERWGFLGGNPTAGLMSPLMSFFRSFPPAQKLPPDALVPIDAGNAPPVVAGVFREFLDRLVAAGGAVEPSHETGNLTLFDPEVFKSVALDLLDDAGVDYLFYSQASGVVMSDRWIEGVVIETSEGPKLIRSKCVVDSTGDGFVAAAAGEPYTVGGKRDGLTEPVSVFFRMVGFDHAKFAEYVRTHPDDWNGGVQGLQSLLKKAKEAGDLDPPGEHVMIFATPHEGEVLIDFGRVINMRGANVWDMTRAEAESRRQVISIARFLRKYVPGFANAYAIGAGSTLVIREYRRFDGEYKLANKDVLKARKFPDVIARGAYPVDVHHPADVGTTLKPIPPGEAYDIPLRCLLPSTLENLVLSGRCISGEEEAEGSYRTNPICMATGHAAGVCAALAARADGRPKRVSAPKVQEELVRQGANLGLPPELLAYRQTAALPRN